MVQKEKILSRRQAITASGAVFDSTRKYRYSLYRRWQNGKGIVTFVMLNPSTADANHNDPTITRCIGLAQDLGYCGLNVVNLFAFRATDPKDLKASRAPVGRQNDVHILENINSSQSVVLAWGNHGIFKDRDKAVLALLSSYDCHCLGLNLGGQPKHPLYVSGNSSLLLYNPLLSQP